MIWIDRLMPSDTTLVHWSFFAWLLCLACLSPALWRIIMRRPRNLDPIWGMVSVWRTSAASPTL